MPFPTLSPCGCSWRRDYAPRTPSSRPRCIHRSVAETLSSCSAARRQEALQEVIAHRGRDEPEVTAAEPGLFGATLFSGTSAEQRQRPSDVAAIQTGGDSEVKRVVKGFSRSLCAPPGADRPFGPLGPNLLGGGGGFIFLLPPFSIPRAGRPSTTEEGMRQEDIAVCSAARQRSLGGGFSPSRRDRQPILRSVSHQCRLHADHPRRRARCRSGQPSALPSPRLCSIVTG
jgi:hypothetical protein